MSDSAKRNKISPLSLFYILFICRIVVCLTSVHSISTTEINSQALISFVIAMVMTVVFSLPAVFCYKMNKNPIDIKWVSKLYYVYFILVVAVSVSRFSYFASTTLNPETQGWLFALFTAQHWVLRHFPAFRRLFLYFCVLRFFASCFVIMIRLMTLIFIPLLQMKAKVY